MEEEKMHRKDKFMLFMAYLAIFIMLLIMNSCKQIEYITKKEVVTKDSLVTKFVHDSIEVKVKEFIKGDTIRYDSIVYKYKFLRDTIKIQRIDSIPYEVIVKEVKEVPRKRSGYEKTMIRLGWSFLAFILIFIGYKGIKYYFKIKRR